MTVERKYERDIDLLLAEEFSVSAIFATWFLEQTKSFKGIDAKVLDVYVSRSDSTGESDLVVVFERLGGGNRFALHIEDKIDALLQPEQEARYRLRGEAEVLRGDYSEFEVVLCSPASYPEVHAEAASFDSFVTYEAISTYLKSQHPEDPRVLYKANFMTTAAMKNANTWTRQDDARTNAFWKAAYEIATAEFPDLEMKPLTVTKDSTWINFRPLDMPTRPRRIYISFKGDRGFMDLTFTACFARLFLPKIRSILAGDMTVHQTGKSTAIRIQVEAVEIRDLDDAVLAQIRNAFAACVRLVQFYRKNRQILDEVASLSVQSWASEL
jgi:hypothetical protein